MPNNIPQNRKKIESRPPKGGFVYPGPMHEAIPFYLECYWDSIKECVGKLKRRYSKKNN